MPITCAVIVRGLSWDSWEWGKDRPCTACSVLCSGGSQTASPHGELGPLRAQMSELSRKPSCGIVLKVENTEAKCYPVPAKAKKLQNAHNCTNSGGTKYSSSEALSKDIPAYKIKVGQVVWLEFFFFNQLSVCVSNSMDAGFEMMWFSKISVLSWGISQSIQGSKTHSRL